MTRIRAIQGHSIQVDLELAEATPSNALYHSTVMSFADSIMKYSGLKGDWFYVHFFTTVETAAKVGQRHGEPVIFQLLNQ